MKKKKMKMSNYVGQHEVTFQYALLGGRVQ